MLLYGRHPLNSLPCPSVGYEGPEAVTDVAPSFLFRACVQAMRDQKLSYVRRPLFLFRTCL